MLVCLLAVSASSVASAQEQGTPPATASPTAGAGAGAGGGQGGAAEPGPAATKRPGPPAAYYASYGLVAIGALAIFGIIGLYLFQAPGFRRQSRGAAE